MNVFQSTHLEAAGPMNSTSDVRPDFEAIVFPAIIKAKAVPDCPLYPYSRNMGTSALLYSDITLISPLGNDQESDLGQTSDRRKLLGWYLISC